MKLFGESASALATGSPLIKVKISYLSRAERICEAKGIAPCWHCWLDAVCAGESFSH